MAFLQSLRYRDQKLAPAARQRGMTLVVSLIFLLILTILGVTAMNTSTLQQKMAGNLRDADMALQAAETGLRGGEGNLNTLYVGGKPTADATGSSGVWLPGTTNTLSDSWWLGKPTYTGPVTNASANPQYVLEEGDFVEDGFGLSKWSGKPGTQFYRITSRAVGVSPDSRALLEEMYRVRSN